MKNYVACGVFKQRIPILVLLAFAVFPKKIWQKTCWCNVHIVDVGVCFKFHSEDAAVAQVVTVREESKMSIKKKKLKTNLMKILNHLQLILSCSKRARMYYKKKKSNKLHFFKCEMNYLANG